MFKNKYKGKFIAIEGLDGSGATTQSLKLDGYLKKEKIPFWLTQEPTSSIVGNVIKGHLFGEQKITTPLGLQLLFAADRAYHLEEEIIPRLQKGVTVITDRYFLSSVAYGSLDISDENWLYQINDQFILPDLTILLKVPAKVCIKRIKESRLSLDLFESENKLAKVWNTYERISKKYPNIVVIDGEKNEDEVFKLIQKEISSLIK